MKECPSQKWKQLIVLKYAGSYTRRADDVIQTRYRVSLNDILQTFEYDV